MMPRSVNRATRWAESVLDRINRRLWWDHNERFHPWLLARVPQEASSALDVGCGSGLLVSRLATRVDRVLGVDPDQTMVAAALARAGSLPGVSIRPLSAAELTTMTSYDVVTAVAVLHHLDLEAGLAGLGRLVTPGGRLLVVGLARSSSPADRALDFVAVLANPLLGFSRRICGRTSPGPDPTMPVREPKQTYAEVRAAARRQLPGARYRRRLFFRYTLEWTAPVG